MVERMGEGYRRFSKKAWVLFKSYHGALYILHRRFLATSIYIDKLVGNQISLLVNFK